MMEAAECKESHVPCMKEYLAEMHVLSQAQETLVRLVDVYPPAMDSLRDLNEEAVNTHGSTGCINYTGDPDIDAKYLEEIDNYLYHILEPLIPFEVLRIDTTNSKDPNCLKCKVVKHLIRLQKYMYCLVQGGYEKDEGRLTELLMHLQCLTMKPDSNFIKFLWDKIWDNEFSNNICDKICAISEEYLIIYLNELVSCNRTNGQFDVNKLKKSEDYCNLVTRCGQSQRCFELVCDIIVTRMIADHFLNKEINELFEQLTDDLEIRLGLENYSNLYPPQLAEPWKQSDFKKYVLLMWATKTFRYLLDNTMSE